jgi:hypothetical protein
MSAKRCYGLRSQDSGIGTFATHWQVTRSTKPHICWKNREPHTVSRSMKEYLKLISLRGVSGPREQTQPRRDAAAVLDTFRMTWRSFGAMAPLLLFLPLVCLYHYGKQETMPCRLQARNGRNGWWLGRQPPNGASEYWVHGCMYNKIRCQSGL